MMLLFSPCKRCPCPCSDAVLRSCEEALAGIIVLPPSSLREFVPVVRDRWEQGRPGVPGAGGQGGGDTMGGGGVWGPGTREHISSKQTGLHYTGCLSMMPRNSLTKALQRTVN